MSNNDLKKEKEGILSPISWVNAKKELGHAEPKDALKILLRVALTPLALKSALKEKA